MGPWRAGCGESRTSGSEGGPEKPTDRKTAGRSGPTPTLVGPLTGPQPGGRREAIPYTERLAEDGVVNSVGSRGDNALAETIDGLYKNELIRNKGPWRGHNDLELTTLEWVDCFNHRRIFHDLGPIPPAELEANHYRQTVPTISSGTQTVNRPWNVVGSD